MKISIYAEGLSFPLAIRNMKYVRHIMDAHSIFFLRQGKLHILIKYLFYLFYMPCRGEIESLTCLEISKSSLLNLLMLRSKS